MDKNQNRRTNGKDTYQRVLNKNTRTENKHKAKMKL